MPLRPLHARILVQRLEEGDQQVGGVIIRDFANEKPQRGQVIAAGNGEVSVTKPAERLSRPDSCSEVRPPS
jgi:chaperonin GroES